MDPQIKRILLDVDKTESLPSKPLLAEIEALVPELAALTGLALTVDRLASAQNSNQLTQVCHRTEPVPDPAVRDRRIFTTVRFSFSRYGRLFTVGGNDVPDRIDELRLAEAVDQISATGFIYVPDEALQTMYDGHRNGWMTWGIRFFGVE